MRRTSLRRVVVLLMLAAWLGVFTATAPAQAPPSFPPEQLDQLVSRIALYPDPLLSQILAAATFPSEIPDAARWADEHHYLTGDALAAAITEDHLPWDPSVQALLPFPSVLDTMASDMRWTTDLGNAFLAQQPDVMDAVQRMRKKAQDKGTLKPTEQQKVETKVVESKQVIVIEQANPQVVYVPTYDPVVVYGPPVYPYPPIYYPPAWYYPTGLAISFGVGVMMGAFWSGGWCCGCGWGGNNVYINHNNNFNRNSNINRGNRVNNELPGRGGGNRPDRGGVNRPSTLPSGGDRSNWQHRPEHRGGAPYRDRATADRFGGTARGDSLARRQAGARQQITRQGGNLPSNRASGGLGNRAGGPSVSNRGASGPGNRSLGGGPDRIGTRDLSRSGGGNRDAFGGGSRGYNGSSARSSSSRGASSVGGGFSRGGGGGRGGGRRR